MTRIQTRPVAADAVERLTAAGISPLLARIFAARGVQAPQEMQTSLQHLLPYASLKNIVPMAIRLADAIERKQSMLIIADYDSDGATACAVGIKALRMFGARVDYLVPNRFEYGYGLTPEIVELAAQRKPDILVTVDNGIASLDGVAQAQRLGIEVLITDHHLPGDTLPPALIVNPNQPGCLFPSKHLAGVGVIFYVMLALRAQMVQRGHYTEQTKPNLACLLDLVALGTVADVVRLDPNNRVLVQQGLTRMRTGRASPGIAALFQVSGRQCAKASSFDLGFMLGPRLNAAGRLDDMSLGIACLLEEREEIALAMAADLDKLNRERRSIEAGMQQEALGQLDAIEVGDTHALSLYRADWHQGVIGILASRIKDRHHRPTIVFAPGQDGELKGSGRSIPGLHLRDALDLVSKRHPQLILKFGGHAAAAGLTIREQDIDTFRAAFDDVVSGLLSAADLTREIATDGPLDIKHFTLEVARMLQEQVWGQGFAQPAFEGRFQVMTQKLLADKHLKLTLAVGKQTMEAMLFNQIDPVSDWIDAVFQLSVNEWNGARRLQLIIEHWSDSA